MRFICAPQDLEKMATCLESKMSPIGFVLTEEEYLSLAARMLGHYDLEDFQMSLEMPDRTDRVLYIMEGLRANEDPLFGCHRLALMAAGVWSSNAEELAAALMSDNRWVRGLRTLPLASRDDSEEESGGRLTLLPAPSRAIGRLTIGNGDFGTCHGGSRPRADTQEADESRSEPPPGCGALA